MIILISSAKTMSSSSSIIVPERTVPIFWCGSSRINEANVTIFSGRIKEILKVSSQISLETILRYRRFFEPDYFGLPAILAYTGVVYKHIAPEDFSPEDFLYMQEHLRIASVGYGLLRPLDSIRPYRLEYDVQLPDFDSGSVADFWKPKLTNKLIEDILADDGILLNLASKEIRAAFDWKKLDREVKIVTPEFKTWRGGKLKTIVIYAKMMRGQMTRYVLKKRIRVPEELVGFGSEEFNFRPEFSDDKSLIFTV